MEENPRKSTISSGRTRDRCHEFGVASNVNRCLPSKEEIQVEMPRRKLQRNSPESPIRSFLPTEDVRNAIVLFITR